MTKPSQQQKPLELPEDMQIIYKQLVQTDHNVMGLYPLIDLLKRPDDQTETLGERLAQLLTDLTATLQYYQTQQDLMTQALKELQRKVETSNDQIQERLLRQEQKLDQLIAILGQPVE